MYCDKCGYKVSEGERFCGGCGSLLILHDDPSKKVETPTPKKDRKKSNKSIALIVAIAWVLIIGLVVGVLLSSSAPEREMKKALSEKDYYIVTSTYDNLIVEGERIAAEKVIVDYINDVITDFNSNFSMTVDAEDVNDFADAIAYEIINYFYNNYGDLFCNSDGFSGFVTDEYMRENPQIDEALCYLEDIMSSKASYYGGLFSLEDAEFMNAIEYFAEVIDEDTFYESAVQKSEEACDSLINDLMSTADEYMMKGDYSAAIQLLENAKTHLDDTIANDTISEKLNSVLVKYADEYAQKAATAFKNGDVSTAIGNMEAAIEIYPTAEYESKLQEYKLYLPLALYDLGNMLSRSSDYRIQSEDEITAVNKKIYSNCLEFRYYDGGETSIAKYLLEGKYDTVSGVYFSPEYNASMNRTGSVYFEAYGDGKLLYTSPTITAESLPSDFEFSVSGIQKLEIKFIGKGSSVWGVDAMNYGDYAAISNFIAYKNIPN